jgi:quercetin dioxygenase-like cupin family protein
MIMELETAMKAMEQVEIETKHYFANGTYTREVYVPAGAVITGEIHRYSCINIVSKGRIKVVSDEGEYEISAPYTFVSGPNVKKAGYALEDTVWINVFPWDGYQTSEEVKQSVIMSAEESARLLEGAQCLL